MPEYLKVTTKLADLKDAEAKEQLSIQIRQVLEALARLEENDRIDPKMLERVVSV